MTQSNANLGVVVRRYGPSSYRAALDLYETDLVAMVGAGYFPVGQSWGPDTSGTGYVTASSAANGILAVTFRYDPWAVAERRLDERR